jgi:hypothetical protein
MLDGTDLASSWGAALAGVASQLPVTLPAAVLATGAAALQLSAGAVVIRALRGMPYASLLDAALGGLTGAVVIGLVALMLLGTLGWFRMAVLLAANLAIVGLGWFGRGFTRPMLASRPALSLGWPTAGAALVVLAWSGAVILQLASPVVPFIDVLPNHVAPAEHLRAFGAFEVLTIAPSPIYGPSRMFLGYTGLIGSMTVLTGMPAALATAAFILPGVLLVAAGMVWLASAIHGVGTGWWMLIAFTLTASFARLADDRATVVVLPLVAFGVVELLGSASGGGPPTAADSDGSVGRRAATLAVALAATVFLHPLIGALTAATVVALIAVSPERYAPVGVPALVGGGILALPQATTMLGVDLPSAVGLVVIPPAALAGWTFVRFTAARRWFVVALRVAGVVAVSAVLIAAVPSLGQRLESFADFFIEYPILAWTVAVGGIVAGRRTFALVPVAAFLIGLLAVVAAAAMPWDTLGIEGLDFEVSKTLHYWTPVFLAVLGAFALQALWDASHLGLALRSGLVAIFLMAAALPIRVEPIDNFHLGEHRMSETLSIHLREAEYGFWYGYPDSRTVITPEQAALVDRLRDEVAAGRLQSRTAVLHVAYSFQQWDATPIGVFGGMLETMTSIETEVSIHTAGGRLYPFDDLPALLEDGYPYLVLEPRDLPEGTREEIVAAGYRSIFANDRGEIFVVER